MSLASRIGDNLSDMRFFGPSVLGRHLGRLRGDRMARVGVPGLGSVHIRVGGSDMMAVRQVFQERSYDLDWPPALGARVKARYEAVLASGRKPVVVDAGANIGAASLWFGLRYPDAAIVAVEPDPGNAAVLRRNLDGRRDSVVLEAAIGAEPGFVTLTGDSSGWAVRTERSAAGVRVVTVDEAVRASGGDAPFIVKIDIEGFESDLFSSNTDWLNECYAVLIEPHDWMLPGRLTSRSFQQALARHPFELFMRGENLIYARVG